MKTFMKNFIILLLVIWSTNIYAQNQIWATKDKQKLVDNYERTIKEMNEETASLAKAQWNFRMAEGKWTIAEVVEHINMWNLITQDQIRYAEYLGPHPELVSKTLPDSSVTAFIYEEKNHTTPDISVPTNLIPDENNLKYFNIKAGQILKKLKESNYDFGQYFRIYPKDVRNLYQIYIIHYGHIDRHLRQIRRVKASAGYPK